MSKYFDRDFFKFFLRFATILSISIIIIIAARIYQNQPSENAGENVSTALKSIQN